MSALNAAALLHAWEEGGSQPPVRRALLLLAAAWPDTSVDEWARASIGQRDGQLLTLREELFGSRLESLTACPQCKEQLEVTFNTQDIRVAPPAVRDRLRVEAGGYDIECRLPTSADLLEVAEPGASDTAETLLDRCVEKVRRGGADVESATLPDEVVKAVTKGMAEADPQAMVQVALTCQACQHRWSMTFDILSYVWNEIEDWAQSLLYDVHALASAYGWREGDILAMSARRRQLYLDMLGT